MTPLRPVRRQVSADKAHGARSPRAETLDPRHQPDGARSHFLSYEARPAWLKVAGSAVPKQPRRGDGRTATQLQIARSPFPAGATGALAERRFPNTARHCSREGRRETMAASRILPERALPGLPLGPHEVRGQTLPSRGCGALRNPTASLASKDSRPPLGLCQPQRFRATPPCLGAPSGESAAPPPSSQPAPNTSTTHVPQFL